MKTFTGRLGLKKSFCASEKSLKCENGSVLFFFGLFSFLFFFYLLNGTVQDIQGALSQRVISLTNEINMLERGFGPRHSFSCSPSRFSLLVRGAHG